MALNSFLRFVAKPGSTAYWFRLIKSPNIFRPSRSYSITPRLADKNAPVKYTTNRAAFVSPSENIEIAVKDDDVLWYQSYVVCASLVVFLVYFGILREENDIDERLKGNPEYQDNYTKYVNLKLKLHYCQQNNLPTEAIKVKMQELEKILNL